MKWIAIIVGKIKILKINYSEKCSVVENKEKCVACASNDHRYEIFNGYPFGECQCEEGYYDY